MIPFIYEVVGANIVTTRYNMCKNARVRILTNVRHSVILESQQMVGNKKNAYQNYLKIQNIAYSINLSS